MVILTLLPPIITFVALFSIVYSHTHEDGIYTNIRSAILYTVLIASIYLVAATELVSPFHLLTTEGVVVIWSVPAISLCFYAWRRLPFTKSLSDASKAVVGLQKEWVFLVIIFFLINSFILSIQYPTNNFDSLAYHMGRVGHWVQNQSVGNYSTHLILQLVFPPFAEWVILHLQLLTGSDRLANSVQLLFFAGSICNVSLIAKVLGGSRMQQLLAALCASTIPMAVLQSNTTQNDVVVAFFFSAFVYFTVRLSKDYSLEDVIFAGISLGLAFLTKGTAYIFAAPFVFWYVILLVKNFMRGTQRYSKIAALLAVPLIAITINGGFYYRNISVIGTPLATANLANKEHAPNYLALVGVKNFLNHMPVTKTLKEILATWTESMGMDLNDPRYSHSSISWMKEGLSFDEDYAQNFVHVLLITAAAATCVFGKRPRLYKWFVATLFASVIFFTAMLQWQPWSNRLETCLFVLSSVFVGYEMSLWKKWILVICSFALVEYGVGALLGSVNHPALPLDRSIFFQHYDSFIYNNDLIACKDYIDANKSCKIGLYLNASTKDYLFYKLLARGKDFDRAIEHVLVDNESKKYTRDFLPDVILSTKESPPETLVLAGKKYIKNKTYSSASLTLYTLDATTEKILCQI